MTLPHVPGLRGWLLAALCSALAATAAAQIGPAGPVMAGAPTCRFLVPEAMLGLDLRWSGTCRDGLAEGRGTLRGYEGGRVVLVFYGRLEAGQPALGVIELDGGFVAGRFEAGRAVADGDRDTLVRAFDEAASAARQMAAGFRKTGNTASYRHYRDKARQLSQQMD
jgi:predicted aminopeptidase